jgi:hypothetical protein
LKGKDEKEFEKEIDLITTFLKELGVDKNLWEEKFKKFKDWKNFTNITEDDFERIKKALNVEERIQQLKDKVKKVTNQRNNIGGALMSEGDELALSDLNSAEAEGWAKGRVQKKEKNAAEKAKEVQMEKRLADRKKQEAKIQKRRDQGKSMTSLSAPSTELGEFIAAKNGGQQQKDGDDKTTFEVRRGKFFEVVCGGILF